MTFFGLNGEEVVGSQAHQVSDANGKYMFDAVLSQEQVESNLALGRVVTSYIEWECQGCGTVVDGPEGHDNDECKERRREVYEDQQADYRD